MLFDWMYPLHFAVSKEDCGSSAASCVTEGEISLAFPHYICFIIIVLVAGLA